MPAPLWRVTFFYTAGNTGWSETLFNNLPTLSAVQAAATALNTARLTLMRPDCFSNAIRVSDDNVFRDSSYVQNPAYPIPGSYSQVVTTSHPSTALFLRLETAPGSVSAASPNRRIFPLHGIPVDQIQDTTFSPSIIWAGNLGAYKLVLTNSANGWCMRTRSIFAIAPTPVGLSISPQASPSRDGLLTTLTAVPSAVLGAYVVFSRVKGVIPPAGRPFLVVPPITNITPFTVGIRGWFPRLTVTGSNIQMEFFSYQLSPIVAAFTDRLGSHKVGRPFGLLRGRRSPGR